MTAVRCGSAEAVPINPAVQQTIHQCFSFITFQRELDTIEANPALCKMETMVEPSSPCYGTPIAATIDCDVEMHCQTTTNGNRENTFPFKHQPNPSCVNSDD